MFRNYLLYLEDMQDIIGRKTIFPAEGASLLAFTYTARKLDTAVGA
jgi:hypothetical protein